jgi:hypothetical protein
LPRQAFLLLNMPAFAGHTTVRAVLPHTALQSLVSSSGVSRGHRGCMKGEQPMDREGAIAMCSLDAVASADTTRSVQIEASAHPRGGSRASVPGVAVTDTAETVCAAILTLRLQLPAFLPSGRFCCPPLSAATPHRGNMKALTPAGLTPPDRSLRLRRSAIPTFRPQPRGLPDGRFLSRLSAIGCFQASPRMSRLATAPRRIRFVILRTAGSPPVAPHPASRRRSYLRFRSQRPAPARTCTVLTKRPHGRTHPRESGGPGQATELRPWIPACAGMTR